MRRPAEGPKVFPSVPGDLRPIVVFAVGGQILQARFPTITSRPWSDKPILPEIIRMSEKPMPTRPTQPDPYSTLPLECDLPKPESAATEERDVA